MTRPSRTALLALTVLLAAVAAGCGGGAPTYEPAAVTRCLQVEGVAVQGPKDPEVSIRTGFERVPAEGRDPPFSRAEKGARASLWVRPDLARDALKSGPGRVVVAYVPSGWEGEVNDEAPLEDVVARSSVDLLFFGSQEGAAQAEEGAGDQARALEEITLGGADVDTAADVNEVRGALREAGGPTVEADGNLLVVWRTVPTAEQEETLSGCLERVVEDEG